MEPVNKNATPNARRLLQYLSSVGGSGIITGQHTQTVAMEEIGKIRKITGKEPALRGFELLAYSPNICYETGDEACRTEIDENRGTLAQALAFGRSGGILTFTWNCFSPLGGRDKSFYSRNTDFDPERILRDGTPEREAFYHDLDRMAECLKPFLAEDIPVLWRPFHESEGDWFWWGRRGPSVAAKLFRMQYEYFVGECGLHNLIWVWNCPLAEGYPGDDVVDILSSDHYVEKRDENGLSGGIRAAQGAYAGKKAGSIGGNRDSAGYGAVGAKPCAVVLLYDVEQGLCADGRI